MPEASEQWLELSASSPIDLSDPEQRELVALVLQKLAAHGAVQSGCAARSLSLSLSERVSAQRCCWRSGRGDHGMRRPGVST